MKKKFISVTLALAMVLALAPTMVSASDTVTYGYFTFDKSRGTIMHCDIGISGDVAIPREIDGVTVTAIYNYAFQGCTALTSVIIPDSVTSIGFEAFSKCSSLTSASLPYGITVINSGMFEYCTNLTDIVIPDSVTSINFHSFYGCTLLANINIPTNLKTIDNGAFAQCESLTEVILPDSLDKISMNAFVSCTNLKHINIPDSVTEIGESAFAGCSSLDNINIPDSVVKIGYDAFAGTPFYNDENNWEDNALYMNNRLLRCDVNAEGSFSVKQGTVLIADNAFGACSKLTDIYIPDGVKYIGNEVFYNCELLTSVIFPDSIIYIGTNILDRTAIYNDENNWDNNVLYVGKYLIEAKYGFSGDYSVKEGTLLIAEEAFRGRELTKVYIPSDIKFIASTVFNGCDKLSDIYYCGTAEQWNNVEIGEYNDDLTNAIIHFSATGYNSPSITTTPTVKVNNDKYTFGVTLDSAEYSSGLITALYRDGIMTGIEITPIEAGDTEKSVTVTADNADSAKVFIWSSTKGMKPLCSDFAINAQDFIVEE